MAKFKGLKKDYTEQQKQTTLKNTYGITDNTVTVVERKTAIVPVLRLTGKGVVAIARIIATASILTLAIVGLIALIYPHPRQAILEILLQAYTEVTVYLSP